MTVVRCGGSRAPFDWLRNINVTGYFGKCECRGNEWVWFSLRLCVVLYCMYVCMGEAESLVVSVGTSALYVGTIGRSFDLVRR